MKERKNLAFIVELFLLFTLMLMVTTVLTKAFVSSRMQSLYARRKTDAVIIAERVAEIAMASDDLEDALKHISNMDSVSDLSSGGREVSFRSGVSENDGETFRVQMQWDSKEGDSAVLNTCRITVLPEDGDEPLYVLDSGSFRKGAVDGT